ncbi:MAG: TrkA family potassium uptake protein [Chloroflexota bacterium]|nr:MAG: TrkA family potassium uptake protein [Chloroflexota bacterium]
MNIIVIGCGRVGAELAYRLYKKGHRVTVVDQTDSAFANLPHDFRGRTIEGEALDMDVLHRAGIEQASGLAMVTSSDSLNAVIAHLARTVYNISNVVVRNYDPHWRSLYEAFGQQVISSSSWGAQRLEELLYHAEMHTVFSSGNGEVEVYEFAVPEAWAGKILRDLLPEADIQPVSVTRAGRAMMPDLNELLVESDIILVSATLDGIEALRQRLNQLQEG